MFEYKIVKLSTKNLFNFKPEHDYRQIIKKHAAEGWRFVQIFNPGQGPHGVQPFVEIIFEKKVA